MGAAPLRTTSLNRPRAREEGNRAEWDDLKLHQAGLAERRNLPRSSTASFGDIHQEHDAALVLLRYHGHKTACVADGFVQRVLRLELETSSSSRRPPLRCGTGISRPHQRTVCDPLRDRWSQPVSMQMLAAHLSMDRTTLTAALKPLERRALVYVRQRDLDPPGCEVAWRGDTTMEKGAASHRLGDGDSRSAIVSSSTGPTVAWGRR